MRSVEEITQALSNAAEGFLGDNGLRFRTRCIATGNMLHCVFAWGSGWEHASISRYDGSKNTVPNWDEMCWIKKLLWTDDETVVQYHPKQSEYVNVHPGVLHLWKPAGVEIELPPTWMV